MTDIEQNSVVLFGPNGQVGRALARRLPPTMRIVTVDRTTIDLRDPSGIRDLISRERPTIVVNAAAYTAVDAAESDERGAHAVNAEAPRAMAEAAAAIGAGLVHFSTDYVFDGTAQTPYREDSATNPLSVYGRTKLKGDLAVADSGAAYLIFRTSWVYTAGGKNFVTAILKRATETGSLRVVDDQIGAPTSADAIANGVCDILARLTRSGGGFADALQRVAGVYNMTAQGSTTWFEFARAILARTGISAQLTAISSADFGAPARRPAYSLLDGRKLLETFGVQLPEWTTQLDDVLARLANRAAWPGREATR